MARPVVEVRSYHADGAPLAVNTVVAARPAGGPYPPTVYELLLDDSTSVTGQDSYLDRLYPGWREYLGVEPPVRRRRAGDSVTLSQDVRVAAQDVRTPRGNRARRARALPRGTRLLIVEVLHAASAYADTCFRLRDQAGYEYDVPVTILRDRAR